MSAYKLGGLALIGVAIVLLSSITYWAIGGSTNVQSSLSWAVLFGGGIGALLALPIFGLQYVLLSHLLNRKRRSIAWCIGMLNFPILLGACIVLGVKAAKVTPQKRFEQLVIAPAPPSVERIEQGGELSFDSRFWVIRFDASKEDLDLILAEGNYVQTSMLQEDVRRLALRVSRYARMSPIFTNNWQAFSDGNERERRIMFIDPTAGRAVFIFDSH